MMPSSTSGIVDRQNPSQCHGLAGKAELFVDLARVTGEPGLYSPERVCGSSAVRHFLRRLIDPQLRLPFL